METVVDDLKIKKNEVLDNPVGLNGMEFIEYSAKDAEFMEKLFGLFQFKKIGTHRTKNIDLYRQNDVHFILNLEKNSFADSFQNAHGLSICATGFRVLDAEHAFETAVARGARPYEGEGHSFKAIYGIGDSLIYFIDKKGEDKIYKHDFELIDDPTNEGCGLTGVDHMTNNVPAGDMKKWCDFYESIFNFKEVRFFDIKGLETGLVSKVMMSPCRKIIVPINEPTDKKSQIQEYLDEYQGSGIQHLAMKTTDICKTVAALRENGVDFLDVPDTYYENLFDRVPGVTEDINDLRKLKVLVDGDSSAYLLQIFTKNLIGPIFFEIIQRKGHKGFGEGNFQALFEAIEEDQRRRGYL